MIVCQFIILILLVLNLICNLWTDFHGRKAREAGGFAGAVGSLVVFAFALWLYKSAGALSLILPL